MLFYVYSTVNLGNKERFDKEQIGIKEPFPVTSLPFTPTPWLTLLWVLEKVVLSKICVNQVS